MISYGDLAERAAIRARRCYGDFFAMEKRGLCGISDRPGDYPAFGASYPQNSLEWRWSVYKIFLLKPNLGSLSAEHYFRAALGNTGALP